MKGSREAFQDKHYVVQDDSERWQNRQPHRPEERGFREQVQRP
jgi:hypothetical protein